MRLRARSGRGEDAKRIATTAGMQTPGQSPEMNIPLSFLLPPSARICPAQPRSSPDQAPELSDSLLATLRGTLAGSAAPPGERC